VDLVPADRARGAGEEAGVIGEPRKAACVAIGDELIAGDYPDTNSGMVAARLAELGIVVERFVVAGDDRAALERTFYELARDFQIVVASGGIGPTLDDVTREAAAAAAGVPLERDEATLGWLRDWFARSKRPMAESNERQAWFPRGAQIMANQVGTARGFRVWIEGGMLAVLPGPPHEARDMLERELLPWIRSTCGVGQGLAQHRFFLLGVPESVFADRAGDWMSRGANPLMGVTAHQGTLHVTMRARAASLDGAKRLVEARAAEFRSRFAADIYSEDDPRPAFAVGKALIDGRVRLATAESCTGGLVSELLTEVPGISEVFRSGWITYSNEAKVRDLGVDPETLAREGAVSAAVAQQMAEGAARRAGADLALSITGVAGPGGGTPEKPVGLVWFGLASRGKVSSHERRFPPVDRASIRRYAASVGLDLLRRELSRRA
jgi:nicotinamide-nucleotide amidase